MPTILALSELSAGSASDRAWETAILYHDLRTELKRTPKKLMEVRTTAVRAVLARARAVIGSSKKETRTLHDLFPNRPNAELDVEQTIDNIMDKTHPDGTDIAVTAKEQKRFDCALMLDTSLSMSGEKLALLAVAAAVLAYKLPSDDFAIISFESTASILKKIRVSLAIEKLVTRILEVPAIGYTNIEAGLTQGLEQLARGTHKRRVGILLSDGKHTAGDSPLVTAARFRQLHVVLLGDFNTDPDACAAIASAGHGSVYPAPSFESLPRVLHRLVTDLVA
ncbi:MAG: hypothetical protein Kow0099_16600 [Candidatus Abyssubacteria bacterium]